MSIFDGLADIFTGVFGEPGGAIYTPRDGASVQWPDAILRIEQRESFDQPGVTSPTPRLYVPLAGLPAGIGKGDRVAVGGKTYLVQVVRREDDVGVMAAIDLEEISG